MKLFFDVLNLDPYYFQVFSATQIQKHISMLILAQNKAEIGKDDENLLITLKSGNKCSFICTDKNSYKVELEI